MQGIDPEESVVVCPVDPYVEADYFEALKQLAAQAEKGESNLVLMGIEPTYPSEKYGYIIPVSKEPVTAVSTFKEKPTKDVAEDYIRQGALWNGGVFAYKLKYVLDKAHEKNIKTQAKTTANSFPRTQAIVLNECFRD